MGSSAAIIAILPSIFLYADGLEQQVAEKDAELLALRAAHAQLREAAQYFADLESCDDPGHAECVGDSGPYCQTHGENNMHATERDQLRAALAASPPHPETQE